MFLHALATVQLDLGHLQCFFPSPAANAQRNVNFLYNVKLIHLFDGVFLREGVACINILPIFQANFFQNNSVWCLSMITPPPPPPPQLRTDLRFTSLLVQAENLYCIFTNINTLFQSPNVTRSVVIDISWFTCNYCACAPML